MDVVILTGGLGSRLRSLVSDRPKTMASINGRPFLDRVLEHLQGSGFCRFILCAGYMADYISDYYSQSNDSSRELILSREVLPLGTAGAVKNAEPLIHGDSFLVVNGDSFCAADLIAFMNFHQKHASLASIVLAHVEEVASYGTVTRGQGDRIIRFEEKAASGPGWINAGIYLFERDVLSLIPPASASSLEKDVFPRLAGNGLYGFSTREPMIDIGTPERLLTALKAFP
ncbi:MAG: nucleotidyltransferase family protein [Deltaproteobacteria bacterium]|nr:nucleotidyltransferase family protein [Deltaproteobacteria bacterium]